MAGAACAICGIPLCDRCDAGDRRAALCDEHGEVRLIQGWSEVHRTVDEAEAILAAEALRALGFDAQILSQKDHANVVGVGGLAVVRILVPPFQHASACEALEDAGAAGQEGIA